MDYDYDLQEIRESLTSEQIFDILAEFHGEPQEKGDTIISKTICHHPESELDEAGHKLYYYGNTHLFHCFSGGCAEASFDIFELVRKVKTMSLGAEYDLPHAVDFVAQRFGFSKAKHTLATETSIDEYFTDLKNYDRIYNVETKNQIVELKTYDGTFLKNLPHPIIEPWVEDNISPEVMNKFEIAYDPKNCGVVIPHRDINGNLIGIRERTLIQENADQYGKYLPLKMNGIMYRHPLSFSLYGLYQNKANIQRIKKAIVVESEKSVMQLDDIMGDNNISCACCGSSLITYQVSLLMQLGINEIIVGFDHDWHDVNDLTAKKKIRNLKNIQKKYGNFIKITYIWDRDNLTSLHCSPSDCGSEIFYKLFKNRINLY